MKNSGITALLIFIVKLDTVHQDGLRGYSSQELMVILAGDAWLDIAGGAK